MNTTGGRQKNPLSSTSRWHGEEEDRAVEGTCASELEKAEKSSHGARDYGRACSTR